MSSVNLTGGGPSTTPGIITRAFNRATTFAHHLFKGSEKTSAIGPPIILEEKVPEPKNHTGQVVSTTDTRAKKTHSLRGLISKPFTKNNGTSKTQTKSTEGAPKTLLQRGIKKTRQNLKIAAQFIIQGSKLVGFGIAAGLRHHNFAKADALKAQAMKSLHRFINVFFSVKFGNKISAPCRNIGKTPDLNQGVDKEKISEFQNKARRFSIPLGASSEKIIKDGCCQALIVVALGKYHEASDGQKKPLSNILHEMDTERGVPSEATALQAVYESFDLSLDSDRCGKDGVANTIDAMLVQQLGASFDTSAIHTQLTRPGPYTDVYATKVLHSLAVHELIQNHPSISEVDQHAMYALLADCENPQSKLPTFSSLKSPNQQKNDSLFYQTFQPQMHRIRSAESFEDVRDLFEECTQNMDLLEKGQCRTMLETLISCNRFLNFPGREKGEDSFTVLDHDPVTQARLLHHTHSITDQCQLKTLFGIQGMEIRKVKAMGDPAFRKSDQDFLNKLDKLTPGSYSIGIETNFLGNDSEHALSLIKNPNGSFTILDPNVGTIECQNLEDCKVEFGKLLNNYPEPKNRFPGSSGTNHMISIYKVVPQSNQGPTRNYV